MWSICKKELTLFFGSLTGYLAILLYLLFNGLYLFVLADSRVFSFGYASADPFFRLSPWVFIILIPALSMRLFADEYRAGTMEILLTRPISLQQLVLGKYLALILVILFALLPTVIYMHSLRFLSLTGAVDTGGIIGSYVGLFLLASTFAAIGLCCSAATSLSVVAFLMGAFLCLLQYMGWNALSRLDTTQNNLGYYLDMFGMEYHYHNLSRGVVDLRSVIYFLSLTALALYVTRLLIIQRKA